MPVQPPHPPINNRKIKSLDFFEQCYEHLISISPSNRFFSELRYDYYKNRLKRTGGYFTSGTGFHIMCPGNVSIGKNCFFNRNVFLGTMGDPGTTSEIIIGDNCLFGMNVVIVAGNHPTNDKTKLLRESNSVPSKIIIGDDCWIGAGVVISKDVVVCRGSVIGANSVVTKYIPPYSVALGSPATVVKQRGAQKDEILMKFKEWK